MFLKVIYLFETSYFCQFRLCLGWTFGWRDFGWKCCNQIRICLNLHSWKSVNLLGGPLEKLESRGLDQMYSHPSLHQLPALWDINLSPRIKRELYSTTDLVGQSLKWRKSAYPSSESSSSALNVLEWNSFSSLLPLSLFHLGISTFPRSLLPRCGACTLFFFLSSEEKASRKAWCCTWKRDFWLSREPTSSEHTWAHSWIFFCCSGTYGYIMKVWDLRGH